MSIPLHQSPREYAGPREVRTSHDASIPGKLSEAPELNIRGHNPGSLELSRRQRQGFDDDDDDEDDNNNNNNSLEEEYGDDDDDGSSWMPSNENENVGGVQRNTNVRMSYDDARRVYAHVPVPPNNRPRSAPAVRRPASLGFSPRNQQPQGTATQPRSRGSVYVNPVAVKPKKVKKKRLRRKKRSKSPDRNAPTMSAEERREMERKEAALQNIADDVHSATTSRRAAATWLKSLDIEAYESKHFAPINDDPEARLIELPADLHGAALRREELDTWAEEVKTLQAEWVREEELSPRKRSRLDFAQKHIKYVSAMPQMKRTRVLGAQLNKGMRAREALREIAKALGWVPHDRHLERNRDLAISGGRLFGNRREDTEENFLERQRHKSVGALVMVTNPLNESWQPSTSADHLIAVTGAPPTARAMLLSLLSESQAATRTERVVLSEFDAFTALSLETQFTEYEEGDAKSSPKIPSALRSKSSATASSAADASFVDPASRTRAAQQEMQAAKEAERADQDREREAQRIALEGDGWHKRSYERSRLAAAELQWRAVAASLPFSEKDRRGVCEMRLRDMMLKGSRALAGIDNMTPQMDARDSSRRRDDIVAGDLLALSAAAAAWEIALKDNDDATGEFGKQAQDRSSTHRPSMRQLDASTVACLVGLLETYSDRIAPASVDATKRSSGTSSEGAAGSHKEEEEFDELEARMINALINRDSYKTERIEPWLILVCASGAIFQILLNSENSCSMLLEIGCFQALIKTMVACAAIGDDCEVSELNAVDAASEAKTASGYRRRPALPATKTARRTISQLSRLSIALCSISCTRLFFYAPPEHRQLVEALMHIEVDDEDSDGDEPDGEGEDDDVSVFSGSSRFSRRSSTLPAPIAEPDVEETLLNPKYHGFAFAVSYLARRPPLHFFGMSSEDLLSWNEDEGVDGSIDPRLDDWICASSAKLNMHLPWAYLPATCRPKAPLIHPALAEMATSMCRSVLHTNPSVEMKLIKPRPEPGEPVVAEMPEGLDDALNVYPEPTLYLRGIMRWKRYATALVGFSAYETARGVKYDAAHRGGGSLLTPALKIGPYRATEFRATDAVARLVNKLVPPSVRLAALELGAAKATLSTGEKSASDIAAAELGAVKSDCCYAALYAIVPFCLDALTIASEDAGLKKENADNPPCYWDATGFVAFALRSLAQHIGGTEDACEEISSTVSHHVGLWRYVSDLPGLRAFIERVDPFDVAHGDPKKENPVRYANAIRASLIRGPAVVFSRLAISAAALGAFGDSHDDAASKIPHNERSIASSFACTFAGGWGLGSRCAWHVLPDETSRAISSLMRRRRFGPSQGLRVLSTSQKTGRAAAEGFQNYTKIRLVPTMETRPLLPYAVLAASRMYLHGDECTLNGDDRIPKEKRDELKAAMRDADGTDTSLQSLRDALITPNGDVLGAAQRMRLSLGSVCLDALCETAHRALSELEQISIEEDHSLGMASHATIPSKPLNKVRALRALGVAMGGLAHACQKAPKCVAAHSGLRKGDSGAVGSEELSNMLGSTRKSRSAHASSRGGRQTFVDSYHDPDHLGAVAAIRNVLVSDVVPPESLSKQCASCCAWLLANVGPGDESMWPVSQEVPWHGDLGVETTEERDAVNLARKPKGASAATSSNLSDELIVFTSLLPPSMGTEWCARAFNQCVRELDDSLMRIMLESQNSGGRTSARTTASDGGGDIPQPGTLDAQTSGQTSSSSTQDTSFLADVARLCSSVDMTMGTIWLLIEVDGHEVTEALERVDRSLGWAEASYNIWNHDDPNRNASDVERRLNSTMFARLIQLTCRDVEALRGGGVSTTVARDVLRLKAIAARLSFQLIAKDTRCRDIALEMDAGSKLDDMLQAEERQRKDDMRSKMVSRASDASVATSASAVSMGSQGAASAGSEGEDAKEISNDEAMLLRDAQKQLDELKGIVAATRLLLLDHEDILRRKYIRAGGVVSNPPSPDRSDGGTTTKSVPTSVKLAATALSKLMTSREVGIREVGVRGAAILAREHKSIGQHGVIVGLKDYMSNLKPTYRRSDRRRQAIGLAALLNLSQSDSNKFTICEHLQDYLYSAIVEARAAARKRADLFAMVTASLYTADGGMADMMGQGGGDMMESPDKTGTYGTLVLGNDEIAAAEDERDDHRESRSDDVEVADRTDKTQEYHKQHIRLCLSTMRLATGILYNISTHPRNRTPMYRSELARKKFLVDHTEAEVLAAAIHDMNDKAMDYGRVKIRGRWNAAVVLNKFKAQHEKKQDLIQFWSPPPAPEILLLVRFVVRTHAERSVLDSLDARCIRAPRYMWQVSATGEWELKDSVEERHETSTGVDRVAARADNAMINDTGDFIVTESQLALIQDSGSPAVAMILRRGSLPGADPLAYGEDMLYSGETIAAPGESISPEVVANQTPRNDAVHLNKTAFATPRRLSSASLATVVKSLASHSIPRDLMITTGDTVSGRLMRCELGDFLRRYSARMRKARDDAYGRKPNFVLGVELYGCIGEAFPNMRPYEVKLIERAIRSAAKDALESNGPLSARGMDEVRISHVAFVKAVRALAKSQSATESSYAASPEDNYVGSQVSPAAPDGDGAVPVEEKRLAPPAPRLSLYSSPARASRRRSRSASPARRREAGSTTPRWALRNEMQKPVRPFYGSIDFEEEGLTLRDKTRVSCWSPRIQQVDVMRSASLRAGRKHQRPSSAGANGGNAGFNVFQVVKDAVTQDQGDDLRPDYSSDSQAVDDRAIIGSHAFRHASWIGSDRHSANSGRDDDTLRLAIGDGHIQVDHQRPSYDESRGIAPHARDSNAGMKPLSRAILAPPERRGRDHEYRITHAGDVVSVPKQPPGAPQPGERAASALTLAAAPSRPRNRYQFGPNASPRRSSSASPPTISRKSRSRQPGRLVAFAAIPGSKIAEELFPPPVYLPTEIGAHSRPYHVHHTRLVVDEVEVCWRAIPAPRSLFELLGWEPSVVASDDSVAMGEDGSQQASDDNDMKAGPSSASGRRAPVAVRNPRSRRSAARPENNVPSPPPSAFMTRVQEPKPSSRPRAPRVVRVNTDKPSDTRSPPLRLIGWPGCPTGRELALWSDAKSLTPLRVADCMDAYLIDLQDGYVEPICSEDFGAAFDAFLKHTLTDYYDVARDLPRLLSCGNGVEAMSGECPPILAHVTPSPVVPVLPEEDEAEDFYDEDPISSLPYRDDGPKRDGAFHRDKKYFRSHGKTSIFAPRIYESEFGSMVEGRSAVDLYDDDDGNDSDENEDLMNEDHFYPGNEPMMEAVIKPMRRDWERCVAKQRFRRLCKGPEGAKEIKRLEEAFANCHRFMSNAYMYYSCLNQKPFDEFGVCLNAFNIFADDSKVLNGRPERRAVLDLIFLESNLEEGDRNHADNVLNDDHALLRYEFCETVIRIALASTVRPTTSDKGVIMAGKPTLPPADALTQFVETVERQLRGGEATLNLDAFRRRRLYRKSTNRVLRRRERVFRSIFVFYTSTTPWTGKIASGTVADPKPGKTLKGPPPLDAISMLPPPSLAQDAEPEEPEPTLTKGEKQLTELANGLSCTGWLRFLSDCGILFTDVTGVSRREAILCFNWSRPMFVDELRLRKERSCLKWTYFLEAFCRLADFMSPPEDREMEMLLQPDLAAPIPRSNLRRVSRMDLPRKDKPSAVSFDMTMEEKLRSRPAAYRYYTKLIGNSARRAALYIQERGGEPRKSVQMATGLGHGGSVGRKSTSNHP